MTQTIAHQSSNMAVVKTLTYLMFAMFAMTTDSVGPHHSRSHQDVSVVADGGRHVSVRDDGGYCDRWPLSRVSSRIGSDGDGRSSSA